MNEEQFLDLLRVAIEFKFKYMASVHVDKLNNRVMVSINDSDDAFDIQVEKQ